MKYLILFILSLFIFSFASADGYRIKVTKNWSDTFKVCKKTVKTRCVDDGTTVTLNAGDKIYLRPINRNLAWQYCSAGLPPKNISIKSGSGVVASGDTLPIIALFQKICLVAPNSESVIVVVDKVN